jgi:hypothetical protein
MPDFSDGTAPWLPPCDELRPFDDARRDLLRQKRDELATATGGVSSGTGAILRGWAYIHAAGEYWASKFAATGDRKAFDSMVQAFRAASTEEARARDSAAWEATARQQADARRQQAALRQRQAEYQRQLQERQAPAQTPKKGDP